MEKVLGIGGVFFRSQDPGGLAEWYLQHLGVALVPQDASSAPWMTEAGVTVFSPFPADTDYFRDDRQFMINFRVADLDAMTAQLAAAGIAVGDQVEMEGIGAFAHMHDPEGNPIELWQPAG
ncbi:MAG: VOC family protein [Acidimicrobiales bacterium]